MLREQLARDDRDDARSSLAREVSIELIFAWANGLRRIAMCSIPGSFTSST